MWLARPEPAKMLINFEDYDSQMLKKIIIINIMNDSKKKKKEI